MTYYLFPIGGLYKQKLPILFQPFNEETNFYSNSYAASIIPINHCVAAIGLAIANLLHTSVWWTVIMGRLANFAFYVFVCYHAIRKVKHYKSLFFTVACLPAAIWLAAAYSTDPVLLAASLMFLTIYFCYRFDGIRQIKKAIWPYCYYAAFQFHRLSTWSTHRCCCAFS